MKTCYSTIFTLLFGAFLFSACAESDEPLKPVSKIDTLTVKPSMKGWEVYSWPEGNKWKFAFLVGTNRLKTLEEVTTQTSGLVLIRVTGADSVKLVLNRFPRHETIGMISQEWLHNIWGAQTYGNLQLPPQSVINDLVAYGTQKNLTILAPK